MRTATHARWRARGAISRSPIPSEPVRLAAAAARLDVRVLDREPGAHHVVVDEVDLAAAQVGRAELVDVDLDPVVLDDVVAGRLLVLPPQLVRHAGAAAADHADAQAPLG